MRACTSNNKAKTVSSTLLLFLSLLLIQEASHAQTYYSPPHIISEGTQNCYAICPADLNGNGYTDIIVGAAWAYKLFWYENIDGQGSFSDSIIISASAGNVNSIFASDIDNDGDIDLMVSQGCHGRIHWYENLNGEGYFSEKHFITDEVEYNFCVHGSDINNDGYTDAISASRDDNKIAWYQNNGNGTFGAQQIITTSIVGPRDLDATDLDGDGDIDLISGAYWSTTVSWYKNMDGSGNFSAPITITDSAEHVTTVFSADLDGDGDMDVLSSSQDDHKIAWYENTDGEGSFGPQKIICNSCEGAMDVCSADLDNDGDWDVVSASGIDDKIRWFENLDGKGNFGAANDISSNLEGPTSIHLVDLNGDSNIDVISGSDDDDKVVWFENITLSILDQPQNKNICPYSNTSLVVTAVNADSYQWQVNEDTVFKNISPNNTYSGVTTNTLFIDNADISMSGNYYRCILSNQGGSVESNEVVLFVEDIDAPVISSQHGDESLEADSTCKAILPDYTADVVAYDNCDSLLTILQDPSPGTLLSGLDNPVSLSVIDDNNNSSILSFNVEVLEHISPEIVCVGEKTIQLHKGHTSYLVEDSEFDLIEISDNCSLHTVSNNYNELETLIGAELPIGTTTVVWLVTDYASNIAKCSHEIIINPYKEIYLYPNPTRNKVSICSMNNDVRKIIVLNLNGQPLFEREISEVEQYFDLSEQCSGVYFVKIITDKEVIIKRIIKRK